MNEGHRQPVRSHNHLKAEHIMHTIKQQAKKLVEELPDHATWNDLMYQIYVRQKIALGIQAGQEGRVQSHEEVKRKFLSA